MGWERKASDGWVCSWSFAKDVMVSEVHGLSRFMGLWEGKGQAWREHAVSFRKGRRRVTTWKCGS